MKTRDIQELKNKSAAELERMAKEGRAKLHSLQLDLAAGKVKNVSSLRALKKDIARMMTFKRSAK
jgi:ribosomal protein L29